MSFSDLIDWSEFTDPFFWIPLLIIVAGLAYYFFSPTQTHAHHQIVLPSTTKIQEKASKPVSDFFFFSFILLKFTKF